MRTEADVFDLEAAVRRLEGELEMERAKCRGLMVRIAFLEGANARLADLHKARVRSARREARRLP